MRTLLALAILPALLAPVAAAGAAEDTLCLGQVPTIVGTPGGNVRGTEGPDVILATDARVVRGLGGDDLICVVGTVRRVIAGGGDDQVETLRAEDGTTVKLGAGSDSFTGGSAHDSVDAGDKDDLAAGQPQGSDQIVTGRGRDEVLTGAGSEVDAPNADVIALGPSDDSARVLGSTVPDIDGGKGDNHLKIASSAGGDWVIDNATGAASRNGVAVGPVVGFIDLDLSRLDWDRLRFTGGPRGEDLDLDFLTGRVKDDGPVAIDMGAGDDNVWVRSQDVGPVVGGSGHDWLRIESAHTTSRRTSLFVDLARGFFSLGDSARSPLAGWEQLSASEADHSTFNGDARPNDLMVWGCGNTFRGAGGDDVLTAYECESGARSGSRLYGGPGDDRLTGGVYRDRLIGGPGRDRGTGGGGGDVCAVEIKDYCR